ncbi:MAG: hypothetical protein ACI9Y1_002088 [Lentisphaeria bacterium]|jgi:hypothetical protein
MLTMHKNKIPESRWAAFALHLIASFLLFLVLTAYIAYFWFPDPFMPAGGWEGLKIIFAVDMVIGPTLTLIVYNVKKKNIAFDLSVIAAFQMVCLIAGMAQVHKERIVLQVFTEKGLHLISARQLADNSIPLRLAHSFPGSSPKALALNLPNNSLAFVNSRMLSMLNKGLALEFRTDLYLPLKDLPKENWNWLLEELNSSQDQHCYWVPLFSYHFSGHACLSRDGAVEIRDDKA